MQGGKAGTQRQTALFYKSLPDMRQGYKQGDILRKLPAVYNRQTKQRKDGQTMTTEELKQRIEQETGVPADLLTGETAEETIAHAKALLAFKRKHAAEPPKTTNEQFAEWFRAQSGEEPEMDPAGAALAEIENSLREYPAGLRDGGEVTNLNIDGGSARDKFAEWFGQKTAFNPFKQTGDGWQSLF